MGYNPRRDEQECHVTRDNDDEDGFRWVFPQQGLSSDLLDLREKGGFF